MHIKKYGHACLLVETKGVKIITDPGSYNPTPDATGVAAILITHQHQDHLDIAQVRAIMATNPDVRVITHAAVGDILAKEGIPFETIESGQTIDVNGVVIESVGTEHAIIYKTVPCRNTGFLIDEELFVPGDALHDIPKTRVRVLALPTAAPWMKVADAIDYVLKLKPGIVFPIHDAMYTEASQRTVARWLAPTLEGVQYIDLPAGGEIDL